jgi:hypothetical protein
VRDAGPPLMTLRRRPGGPPICVHGWFLMEDDAARDLMRQQLQLNLYERVS